MWTRGSRGLKSEYEPQTPQASPHIPAESTPSNKSPSDVVSGPQLVKSDRDLAVFPPLSDPISAMSSDFGDHVFPDVTFVGIAASDGSKEIPFKGLLDTGARICLITETVALRFGRDRINSSQRRVVDGISQKRTLTIGQIIIRFRRADEQHWYIAPFHVMPDSSSHGSFDTVLSGRVIRRMQLLLPGPDSQENHQDSNEESEGLDERLEELAEDNKVSVEPTEMFNEEYEGSDGEKENKPKDASNSMPRDVDETRLYAKNTLLDDRSESTTTNVPSSQRELNTLTLSAVSTIPKLPRSPDSDEESNASFQFSVNSEDTMTSSTTLSSEAEEVTAADMFFQFIAFDDLLKPLFEEAPEQSRLSAKAFEGKMRALLKKFARELSSEAESTIERKAIPFLSQRARFVARELTSCYYWQDEALKLDLDQRRAHQAGFIAHGNDPENREDDDEKDDDEGDDDISNARHGNNDFQVLFSTVREFLFCSAAFTKFRETVRRLLRPERPSWATIRDQWAREVRSDLPMDLKVDCRVKTLIEDEITWADKFKSALEAYSGEEWLWEPFKAPRRPIPEGKVRLQWQCSCESIQWEDISPDLARKVQTMHQTGSGSTSRPQAGLPRGQSFQTATSATGVGGTSGAVAGTGSDPLASNQGNIYTVRGPNTAAILPTTPVASSQYSSRVLFVLLCVPCGWFGIPELKNTVIEVPESQDDDAFFCEFRKHYRSLRGFIHYWFHPRQFSFCHASRFEKWDVDSLGWVCDEMPADQAAYEYVPRPPPRPYELLLTKHEWKHRFCRPAKTSGLQSAFLKMPKRNCRFQISTDASREYVWGLHAQLRVSWNMVMAWTMVILFVITLGGWVFMTRWLSHHPGDLQDAVMPVTLIMMTWGFVCLPLSWLSKKDT